MISSRQIAKFSEIYTGFFDEQLSETELITKAEALITLYKAIYGDPLYNDNSDNQHDNKKTK